MKFSCQLTEQLFLTQKFGQECEFHRGSQCPTSGTQSQHNKIHFMNLSKSQSSKTDLYLMMDTEWKRSNTPVLHKLSLVQITLSSWKSTVFKKSVVFHIDLADCTRRLWSKGISEAHWHLLENWYYVGRKTLYIKHVNKQTHIQKCTCEKMDNYWWV